MTALVESVDLDSLALAGDWLAALFTLGSMGLWFARRRAGARGRRWAASAALGVAGGGALTWGKRVEPDLTEVTREHLALTAAPLRIALLADLHAGRSDREKVARVVERTNSEAPDVVLLAGDFISGYELTDERRAKLEGLRGLRAPGGVFAVLGNHDSEPYGDDTPRRDAIAAALTGFGYRVLHNEAVELRGDLWLAGVDEVQAGRADAKRALAAVPAGKKRLAVAHDWHALDEDVRFDLGLVGHTHGGQLCLPFTSVCAGPARDRPYVRGRHAWRRGGVLYVNRGIGLSKLPVRIGCRPELTLFELGRDAR